MKLVGRGGGGLRRSGRSGKEKNPCLACNRIQSSSPWPVTLLTELLQLTLRSFFVIFISDSVALTLCQYMSVGDSKINFMKLCLYSHVRRLFNATDSISQVMWHRMSFDSDGE
jgi:hypothetical protein